MQAIKDLQTQMCQPEAAQQSTKQLPLSANVGMTKMAAEPSLDHRPAAISDVSQDASDHQEASQEDKQLAEDVIARLLASRQGYCCCLPCMATGHYSFHCCSIWASNVWPKLVQGATYGCPLHCFCKKVVCFIGNLEQH